MRRPPGPADLVTALRMRSFVGAGKAVFTAEYPPGPVTPTDFATIPDTERRKIRSAADTRVPVDFDKRYSPLDRSGSPVQDTHVGTMVFAAGITDQTVKDGLSRVAGALHTSLPPVLGTSRTLEMLVRDGFDKRPTPAVVIPGGIFRFTRFTVGGNDMTLVERIGGVPTAPGPAPDRTKASAALIAKFSNLVWTVIHEVGHGIAFANKALVTRFDAALLADGGGKTANPVTDYGAKSGEGFPEALAFFYTDPTILQASRLATFALLQGTF